MILHATAVLTNFECVLLMQWLDLNDTADVLASGDLRSPRVYPRKSPESHPHHDILSSHPRPQPLQCNYHGTGHNKQVWDILWQVAPGASAPALASCHDLLSWHQLEPSRSKPGTQRAASPSNTGPRMRRLPKQDGIEEILLEQQKGEPPQLAERIAQAQGPAFHAKGNLQSTIMSRCKL